MYQAQFIYYLGELGGDSSMVQYDESEVLYKITESWVKRLNDFIQSLKEENEKTACTVFIITNLIVRNFSNIEGLGILEMAKNIMLDNNDCQENRQVYYIA